MSVCSPALSQGTHDNLHCYFLLKGNRTSLFATPPPPQHAACWKHPGKFDF